MQVLDWLDQNCMDNKTILQYLAELVAVNGGSIQVDLESLGRQQQRFDGPYGRVGLTVDEAFHLVEFKGVLNGFFLQADSEVLQKVVMGRIQEEIDRVAANPKTCILIPGPELSSQLSRSYGSRELIRKMSPKK